MSAELVRVGSILADETRAGVLVALLDGRARTGGELARYLGVAPSTVSEHLGRLLDSGFVRVDPQGRHRYWRLAGPGVAELLETIGARAPAAVVPDPRAPASLLVARSCYDHLAGALAVAIFDRFTIDGHVQAHGDGLELTTSGVEHLAALGVDTGAVLAGRRQTVRACLDWTERSHHLAGAAGAALFDRFLVQGWLRKGTRPRQVKVTAAGQRAFALLCDWDGPRP